MMAGKEFELATGNLLMGRFTWLYIHVPEGWTVKIGDAPADVNYTAVVKDVGWVVDGSASYYVVNLINGDVLELDVRCRKGIKHTSFQVGSYEMTRINGHDAHIVSKTIKRGFRRHPMTQVTLRIPCTETSRTIELVLTGKSSEDIQEMKELFPRLRCH